MLFLRSARRALHDTVVEGLVSLRVTHVDAARHDGHRTRGERPFMGRRFDPPGQARGNDETLFAEILLDFPCEPDAIGRRVAGADDGKRSRNQQMAVSLDGDNRRRVGCLRPPRRASSGRASSAAAALLR